MPIVRHSELEAFALPGITHRTVAGPAQGLGSMEVWLQSMAPVRVRTGSGVPLPLARTAP